MQLALLYSQSQWIEGLAVGAGAVAILAVFAYTRLRWDAHLDMFLAMAGPGGAGMLFGGMWAGPAACHDQSWMGFAAMSAGMAGAAVPLCWFRARCLLEARQRGRGVMSLVLDWIGMEAGMVLGHFSSLMIPWSDTRAIWLHHGIMLTAMALGMLAAAAVQSLYIHDAAALSRERVLPQSGSAYRNRGWE